MEKEQVDLAVQAATAKLLEEAKKQKAELQRIDMPTIQSAVALTCSMGMDNFQLSRDTRIQIEARQAHRYAAETLKQLARKMLKLPGLSDEEADSMLQGIMKQVLDFNRAKIEAAKDHASKNPGPKNTGSA